MRNHAPTMPCSACGGTGHVPLPPRLLAVLRLLRKGPLTSRSLHDAMGGFGVITGANNRLEDLLRLGYATRSKDGRLVVYTATEKT